MTAYRLTAADLARHDGGGFIGTEYDPAIGSPVRLALGEPSVMMHVFAPVLCADGVHRILVSTTISVSRFTPGPDADVDYAYEAEQLVDALTSALAETGLYAYAESVSYDEDRAYYVEVYVVREDLEEHLPSGTSWTGLLDETLAQVLTGSD